MNYWVVCAVLVMGVGASVQDITGNTAQGNDDAQDKKFCEENSGNFPRSVCFDSPCVDEIKSHIKHELYAAFKYLYMGALFGQFKVERPGMAKFFLDSATEERSHAILMMDYLNMRGIAIPKSITFPDNKLWKIGNNRIEEATMNSPRIESALKEALDMEIEVTKKINDIVQKCANDFHAADVFTNPILEEQHTGMRKLQGAIQTIKDLMDGQSNDAGKYLAEYIFDQRMLKGEL